MRGLKGRVALQNNGAMLFRLEKEFAVCMWMKDTPIPLSVAFIDRSGVIVNVADMQPNTETHHCAARPVAYALEVHQGWFAAHGVAAGDAVRPQSCRPESLPREVTALRSPNDIQGLPGCNPEAL